MTKTRKITVLISFLFLWAGILFYHYNQPGQEHRPLKYKKGEPLTETPLKGSTETMVRLDLLQSSKKRLVISKNIFAAIHVYVPLPKAPIVPPPPLVVLPLPPSPEEIARTQAVQALAQFKYLGYLNKGRGKEQGFFSKEGELYIVGKGEAVSGTFMLKEINPNQAILRDSVTGVESTLILSD
ncbi:MAG: hypothetical protein ACYDBV_12575 [Nitrospiria bacterium]